MSLPLELKIDVFQAMGCRKPQLLSQKGAMHGLFQAKDQTYGERQQNEAILLFCSWRADLSDKAYKIQGYIFLVRLLHMFYFFFFFFNSDATVMLFKLFYDLFTMLPFQVEVIGRVHPSIHSLLVSCDSALDGGTLWSRSYSKFFQVINVYERLICGRTGG